jgi:hypothetical protein
MSPRPARVRWAVALRALTGVLAILSVVFISTPVAVAAPAPQPSTFGIATATDGRIDTRGLLNYQASPGGKLTDHIALVNYLYQPLTLRLYTVNAVNATDGSIAFLSAGAPRTDLSTWLTLETPNAKPYITLPPRSTAILPIELSVPFTASPGDHAAAVIASLTVVTTDKKHEKIAFEQRLAMRAYLRISGALTPALRVEKFHVAYSPGILLGHAKVSFIVRNVGNVNLGASDQVKISGLIGPTSTVRLPTLPLLLPGGAAQVTATVNNVWPFVYDTATVRLVPFGQAGAVDPVLHPFTFHNSFWAIPWLIVAIIVGYLVLRWLRRRYAYETITVEEPPATERVEEKV